MRRASAASARRRLYKEWASAPTSARTRGRRRSSRWAWATASGWSSRGDERGTRARQRGGGGRRAGPRARRGVRAALRVGADDPPRSLSAGVAVAVQQGLLTAFPPRTRRSRSTSCSRRARRPWTRRRRCPTRPVGAEGRGGGAPVVAFLDAVRTYVTSWDRIVVPAPIWLGRDPLGILLGRPSWDPIVVTEPSVCN